VCVTGGAGFVGSHLCDALVAVGAEVLVLDNLRTGRLENIAHLLDAGLLTFVEHDVTEHVDVDGPLDAVLHLASPASPRDYLRLPIPTLKAGAVGTWHALGLALAEDARFLLASTSEVYGDPEVHPQPETYPGRVDPTGPRAVYDEAKRFAEALTLAYHRTHGLDVRIARIFNTYGTRMRSDDGRVVPSFVEAAVTGRPLTVHGDGRQTRSLCHVADLVDGLVSLLVVEAPDVAMPVNLGGEEELSVRELADLVVRLAGSDSPIVHDDAAVDDPRRRRPDLTRARALLGHEPSIGTVDGLTSTIAWYRARAGTAT
jgi:dTDP-glucose 4,6-dehydratase